MNSIFFFSEARAAFTTASEVLFREPPPQRSHELRLPHGCENAFNPWFFLYDSHPGLTAGRAVGESQMRFYETSAINRDRRSIPDGFLTRLLEK